VARHVARPDFASDPRTNLWDDAGTELEFLMHQADVRRVAMSRFGLGNLRGSFVLLLDLDRALASVGVRASATVAAASGEAARPPQS